MITGCSCRCSPAGGSVIARASTVPRDVPTCRQCVKAQSPFRAKVSQKWKELTASRASLSMLVTLEERERLKELSRWSNGFAPRGGHTDRRTVRGKQRGKAPAQYWTDTPTWTEYYHEKPGAMFLTVYTSGAQ